MKTKDVYVLMSDGDGTMHSRATPFGVAVDTKEEAERYVQEAKAKGWWSPEFIKIRIFQDKDEAIKWAYPRYDKDL